MFDPENKDFYYRKYDGAGFQGSAVLSQKISDNLPTKQKRFSRLL